jgi:membrane protein YdbS with pleckstrin-like domain
LEDNLQTIYEYTIPWWGIVLIILVVAIILVLVIPLFRRRGGPRD